MSLSLMAQVSEGLQAFAKKESGNALTIMVEGQAKNVAEVMNRKLKAETNSKGKAMRGIKSLSGGMKTFTAARFGSISSSSMDYTYRVEKAKGTKDHSVVHFWISSGNNNFVDSGSYPDEIDAATAMLEGLQHEVAVYEFELMIEEQEKVASNAVKTYDKMVKDSIKLQDQLTKIQNQIEQNKTDRATQLIAIADEEQKLADFRVEFVELKNGPSMVMDIEEVARQESPEEIEEAVEEIMEEKETRAKKKEKEGNEEDMEMQLMRTQSTFDLMLLDAGDSKFNVIKEVKSLTGLSMREAKELVDAASSDTPATISKGISKEEAEVMKEILEEAGAKVEIQ
ncbi:MAG: ribosomal protein L7/L12 [Bacteroidota bacterium]